jgi:hypothetical protein
MCIIIRVTYIGKGWPYSTNALQTKSGNTELPKRNQTQAGYRTKDICLFNIGYTKY